jgi:hypothetical protein
MGTEGVTRKGGKPADGGTPGPRHGNRPRQDPRKGTSVTSTRPLGDRKPTAPTGASGQGGSPGGGTPGPGKGNGNGNGNGIGNGNGTGNGTGNGNGNGNGNGTGNGNGPGERSERGFSERSLYDGGSPSANRLGPAKAMRARDVSRPR